MGIREGDCGLRWKDRGRGEGREKRKGKER